MALAVMTSFQQHAILTPCLHIMQGFPGCFLSFLFPYLRIIPRPDCSWVFGAGVKRLARLGMVDNAPGMSALDMNTAEDMIVRNTREVVPGMIICGMEVSILSVVITLIAVAMINSNEP